MSSNGEGSAFDLLTNGDSLEHDYFEYLSQRVPAYEKFWLAHVVPLTFRVLYRNVRYVRPSLSPEAIALANTSYAIMHHLVWSKYYRDAIDDTSPKERYERTELLYCFFAHARSCGDALGHFALAVDNASKKLGGNLVFGAKLIDRKY